jgi:hypothetical protein
MGGLFARRARSGKVGARGTLAIEDVKRRFKLAERGV